MNLKLTLLSAALLAAGISTLSAGPVAGKYPGTSSRPASPAQAALPSCCTVENRPAYRQGKATKRTVVCKESCPTHPAGYACSSADRKHCSQ